MGVTFPVMSISRHRMGTDSKGISTLVTLHGCPLQCAYCINDYCHDSDTDIHYMLGEELRKALEKDDIYFRMTRGGVTFGGGEPLLYAEEIEDFITWDMPEDWKVTIETSLNTDWNYVKLLVRVVDYWIIDIKDMNPIIYERYTSATNERVISNLKKLSAIVGKEKIKIRIPHIPKYNTDADVERSKLLAEEFAGEIEIFTYKTSTLSKQQSEGEESNG